MASPKYKIIAEHIQRNIQLKNWVAGDKIPSEIELAEMFDASRMTARKAIEELSQQSVLERVPSVGTFVKQPKLQASILEIRNIADEIRERDHVHKMLVLSKLKLRPTDFALLELNANTLYVYKVVIVHLENDVPIQLEERFVNAEAVPDFLTQDFSKVTCHEYLSSVCPLTEAETTLETIMPSKILRHNLEMPENTPCFKVSRRTLSNGAAVSHANLYYPGNKYKFTGHFRA